MEKVSHRLRVRAISLIAFVHAGLRKTESSMGRLRRPRPEQPDKLEVSRSVPTTSLEATKLLAAGGRHPEPEELDGGGETPAEAAEGPSNMGVEDQAPDGLRIYGSRKDKLPQPPDMSEQLSVQLMQLLGKLPKEEPRVLESGEVVTVVADKGYGFIRYR